MKRMIVAALVGVITATAAPASTPSVYVDGLRAHIRYSDLDLHSQTGRDELTARIHVAARMLCTDDADRIMLTPARADCLQALVASGRSKMNDIASR